MGTEVRLKKRLVKWKSDHADEMHGYPELLRDNDFGPLVQQLTSHFMDKYSYDRRLNMDGIIVGYNTYTKDDFAYIVWVINELGDDIEYIAPEDMEIL